MEVPCPPIHLLFKDFENENSWSFAAYISFTRLRPNNGYMSKEAGLHQLKVEIEGPLSERSQTTKGNRGHTVHNVS